VDPTQSPPLGVGGGASVRAKLTPIIGKPYLVLTYRTMLSFALASSFLFLSDPWQS